MPTHQNEVIPEPWLSFLRDLDSAVQEDVRLDYMGGPSARRKKTSLLMADRFKTLSKSLDLSPCVLFDIITHALARTKNIHAGLFSFIAARNAFTIAVSSGLPSQQERRSGASA